VFTGLVENTAEVVGLEARGQAARLDIDVQRIDLAGRVVGESIAVNGVCLTVAGHRGTVVSFDVSPETLGRTTLGRLRPGDRVNVEQAVMPTSRLGGHFVTGHVDGIGRVVARSGRDGGFVLMLEVPRELLKYLAEKGSVTVDGVSLTVNGVRRGRVELFIVPHTGAVTTLGQIGVGDEVNIEVDLLARYVERLLWGGSAGGDRPPALTQEFLERYGFLKK